MRAFDPNKKLSLKGNIVWNAFGSIFNQGCVWLMTVAVVIFSHGYGNSGVLAYAMALGNIFHPIALYNMRTIQVSDLEAETSSRSYVGFRILTISIAWVITGCYLIASTHQLELVIATLAWFVYKTDEVFVTVYYGIDQTHMRMDVIGKSQIIRGILSIGIFSVALLLGANIAVSITIVAVAMILVTFLFDFPRTRRFDSVRPELGAKQAVSLLRRYLPAVLSLALYISATSVSRQIFEITYGDDALGIYAAVAVPTAILPLLAQHLYSPLIGPLSRYWKDSDMRSLYRNMALIAGIIMATCLAFIVLSLLFGNQALTLIYGASISPYTYLLVPVFVSVAFTAIYYFLFNILMIMRSMRALMASALSIFAISALSTPFLIDAFYMNGVNFAVIGAFVVSSLIELVVIVRLCRRKARSERTKPGE